jgi:hypothetical protein
MLRLFGYIAGGAAVLLALDVSVPALGTGLSLFRQSSIVVGAAPAMHVLDRTRKGDKQVTRKGMVLPEVTIRDSRHSTTETVPAAASRTQPGPSRPGAAIPEEKKILEGCDPAFSPLTASARSNFSGRCLANLSVPMRVAAATLP